MDEINDLRQHYDLQPIFEQPVVEQVEDTHDMNRRQAVQYVEKTTGQVVGKLGAEVAHLLQDLFGGLHHVKARSLKKVEWGHDFYIAINVGDSLVSYDPDRLTRLVVLSHDRKLRVEVNALAFRHLELVFHKRSSRTGHLLTRMPTMESHIASIRKSTGEPED